MNQEKSYQLLVTLLVTHECKETLGTAFVLQLVFCEGLTSDCSL